MRKKIVVMILMLTALISVLAVRTQYPEQETAIDPTTIVKTEELKKYLLHSRLEHNVQIRVFGTVLVTEEKEENEWIVNLSQDEFDSLNMLTCAEGGIEKEDFQVAVAATIINRIESESFADDFYGVMNHENAFSSVKNGTIYIMTTNPYEVTLDIVQEATLNAVRRALEGEDPTEELLRQEARRLGLDEEYYAAGGALYFYNPDACGPNALAQRECIKVKVRMGCHYYYKVWG